MLRSSCVITVSHHFMLLLYICGNHWDENEYRMLLSLDKTSTRVAMKWTTQLDFTLSKRRHWLKHIYKSVSSEVRDVSWTIWSLDWMQTWSVFVCSNSLALPNVCIPLKRWKTTSLLRRLPCRTHFHLEECATSSSWERVFITLYPKSGWYPWKRTSSHFKNLYHLIPAES